MNVLTHFDETGAAHMVDVSSKLPTLRRAVAEGYIEMQPETLTLVTTGVTQKGDVLGVARIAGLMASKKTSDLIPLCHPVSLTHVALHWEAQPDKRRIRCVVTAQSTGPTGVEMEALTAIQVALLTFYDMCKAIDRSMTFQDIRLLEKSGGRSGEWRHPSV